MRRDRRSLFVLAIAVATLGTATWLELRRESASIETLTTLDTSAVAHIEIRCSAVCRSRRFERVSGAWRMLEPYAAPADGVAVARLLAIAHAPVRTRLDAAAVDPVKRGLAPAQVTLVLDGTTILIGDEDPIEHDRYVRIGDALLRVPDRFGARLYESPESELEDRPAAPDH